MVCATTPPVLCCYSYLWCSARQQKYDVVLVDTAGRMQDNEPLMKALAKVMYEYQHLVCAQYSPPSS